MRVYAPGGRGRHIAWMTAADMAPDNSRELVYVTYAMILSCNVNYAVKFECLNLVSLGEKMLAEPM